jgi:AraC-like DNA-binding protein
VELIFNFGSPYTPLTGPPAALPVAFIVGFQNKTVQFRVEGTVKIVAARLFAWGALPVLQQDTSSLSNSVYVLDSGWNALLQRLQSHVTSAQYEQAANILQEFLIHQALVRTYDAGTIQAAAKLLQHTQGEYRIAELADYCNLSVRQVERGFQRVVGTTPKTFARTLRFVRAERRLMFDPNADLTQLAYECGYYDQAHFIKDFKAFAGTTPTEYARKMEALQKNLKSKDVVFLQSSSLPNP